MPGLLFLIVAAPLWYGLLGQALLRGVRAPGDRFELALPLGMLLAGWMAEFSLIAHVAPGRVFAAGTVLSLAVFLVRRSPAGPAAKPTGGLWSVILFYALCLGVLAASPYPGMFRWGVDWLSATIDYGEGVRLGGWSSAQTEMLSRTPMFGAAALPLALFRDDLASYEIAAALASASALVVLRYGWRAMAPGGGESGLGRWAFLLASPMLLLHTATVWSKPLAAAAVAAAVIDGWRYRRSGAFADWAWASFWFAGAVAVHQSSILFLPLLLAASHGRRVPWRSLLRDGAFLLLLGLVLAGSYEAWVIHTFGWEAKRAANPAVLYRNGADFAVTAAQNLLSIATGWSPVEVVHRAFVDWRAGGGIGMFLLKEVSFAWVTWVTSLAGTLLGVFFFPVWAAGFGETRRNLAGALGRPPGRLVAAAVLFAIIGNALLSPYPCSFGIAQNGLTPLCLLGFLALALLERKTHPARIRRAYRALLWLGAFPFFLFSILVFIGLRLPAPHRGIGSFLYDNRNDFRLYVDHHFTSLGQGLFPLSLLVAAGLVAFLWRLDPAERA